MNLVDSSGWLEYFVDGQNADYFAKPLLDIQNLIVPTVCIYEVFKVVLREQGEGSALQAATLMQQGQLVEFSLSLALSAAHTSHALKIPMADSIILETARQYNALIWTQDEDFKDLENVKYKKK